MQNHSIADLVRHIDQEGMVVLRGVEQMALAQAVLKHAVQLSGYGLVFDPESTEDLVDYLAVSGALSLEGAITGAGLGALVGLFAGRSSELAALGLAIGLLAGVAQGIDRVQRGWRVRAIRGADGAPCVTIQALESSRS